MIRFTDKKKYLMQTCADYLIDPATGNIEWWTDKGQTGNVAVDVTLDEITGGMGNAVATFLAHDTRNTFTLNAADFTMSSRALSLGTSVSYNGVSPIAENVTATGASLTITMSGGAPVAPYGQTEPICYVQAINAASGISVGGVAYDVDATSGAISGFTATSGTTYKVWYYIKRSVNQVVPISAFVKPRIMTYMKQMPVYVNETGVSNGGNRVGWLYYVCPYAQLDPNGGVTGDQTNPDVTTISGKAISAEEAVITDPTVPGSGTLPGSDLYPSECQYGNLAYYIYVPDSDAEDVSGLAVVGGVYSIGKGTSGQIPGRLVMGNGQLVAPASTAEIKYTATSAPSGVSVSASGLVTTTSSASATEFDVTMAWPATGTATYTNNVTVSVTA